LLSIKPSAALTVEPVLVIVALTRTTWLVEFRASVPLLGLGVAVTADVKQLGFDVLGTHGRIDVCVHGAGVEESRMIADKDDAAFHRVFNGKAEGGLVLANGHRDRCRDDRAVRRHHPVGRRRAASRAAGTR
jgi:NAD(P)-dependent dehydrogenase (short-subunit alcohol dehydrogenase family)